MNTNELLYLIEKEGNELNFRYEGYKCHILRNPLGVWCGYIYVPIIPFKDAITAYQIYNKLFISDDKTDINYFDKMLCYYPHGGITYFAKNNWAYIIGFDCGHYGDLIPSMCNFFSNFDSTFESDTYKDKKFVIDQCKKMIQIIRKNIKNPPSYI